MTGNDSERLTRELASAIRIPATWPHGPRAFFDQAGVRGDREVPSSCPLARWLRGRTSAGCSVGTTSVYATRGPEVAEVFLDDVLKDFVMDFDHGDYPELIDDNSHDPQDWV